MTGFFAVCFDVRDPRRLIRVSNELENFGRRVQRSLFECHLNETQLSELKRRINGWIDEREDHVRYYPLCPKDAQEIIVDGQGEKTVDHDYFMV